MTMSDSETHALKSVDSSTGTEESAQPKKPKRKKNKDKDKDEEVLMTAAWHFFWLQWESVFFVQFFDYAAAWYLVQQNCVELLVPDYATGCLLDNVMSCMWPACWGGIGGRGATQRAPPLHVLISVCTMSIVVEQLLQLPRVC